MHEPTQSSPAKSVVNLLRPEVVSFIGFYIFVSNLSPDEFSLFIWGLIPSHIKNEQQAKEIREYTLNARSETIFEKPSFKESIRERRCLIAVTGFFEWMEFKSKKYPHYIFLKDEEQFALGGIWDEWTNSETGEKTNSFSIVTTEANPMMEKIHNSKMRMPLILGQNEREEWIRSDLKENDIVELMKPFDENKMDAFTISRRITSRTENPNSEEVLNKVVYPELMNEQQSLF